MNKLNPNWICAPYQVGYGEDKDGNMIEIIYQRCRAVMELPDTRFLYLDSDYLEVIPPDIKYLPDYPVRLNHLKQPVQVFL